MLGEPKIIQAMGQKFTQLIGAVMGGGLLQDHLTNQFVCLFWIGTGW